MFTTILWIVGAVLIAAWAFLFWQIRRYTGTWQTKKDFKFDELDKLLEKQDYKFEVNKYLHKYKSDRRWYENRIVRGWIFLSIIGLLFLVDAGMLVFKLVF